MTQGPGDIEGKAEHVFAAWSRLRQLWRYYVPSKVADIHTTRRAIRRRFR